MLFFMFPLKITQKCAYNQRKLMLFFIFPLEIEIRIICQNRMTFIRPRIEQIKRIIIKSAIRVIRGQLNNIC